MQSDAELKAFNDVIANRVVTWWENASSEPGFDRDVLYLKVENIPGRIIKVGDLELPDMRPSPQFIRIHADHREYGAALVCEVVDHIPASQAYNVSLPGAPLESHEDMRAGT